MLGELQHVHIRLLCEMSVGCGVHPINAWGVRLFLGDAPFCSGDKRTDDCIKFVSLVQKIEWPGIGRLVILEMRWLGDGVVVRFACNF